jgi:AcrR family transcriptional regulator
MTVKLTQDTSHSKLNGGSAVMDTLEQDAVSTDSSLNCKEGTESRVVDAERARTRRTRAPAATRQRLIVAAMEVVAERGFDEARSEEIVKRAGLSNGALYTHFKNKNELLLAAFAEQTFFLQDVIADIDATDIDEISKLLRLVRSHPVMPVDESIVGETLAKARRDAGIRSIWLEQLEQIEATYVRWFRSGQEKGLIRKDIQPEAAARLLSSMGTGYQVLWEIAAPSVDEQSWISGFCHFVESLRT